MAEFTAHPNKKRLRLSIQPNGQASPGLCTQARLIFDTLILAIARTDISSFESVIKLSQLLLSTLAKPFCLEGNTIHITASIGITINDLGDRHHKTSRYAGNSASLDLRVSRM